MQTLARVHLCLTACVKKILVLVVFRFSDTEQWTWDTQTFVHYTCQDRRNSFSSCLVAGDRHSVLFLISLKPLHVPSSGIPSGSSWGPEHGLCYPTQLQTLLRFTPILSLLCAHAGTTAAWPLLSKPLSAVWGQHSPWAAGKAASAQGSVSWYQ